MKPLLTTDELIAHMDRKGILFTIDSKERAKDFLDHHNYYLKLASYRENYKKHPPESKKQGNTSIWNSLTYENYLRLTDICVILLSR